MSEVYYLLYELDNITFNSRIKSQQRFLRRKISGVWVLVRKTMPLISSPDLVLEFRGHTMPHLESESLSPDTKSCIVSDSMHLFKMAKGGASNFISDIQKELQCGVCFEQITDAKLLKCLHTFCEECLVKVAKQGTILCPICRATTHVPEQGVQGLSSYCFFNRITELVESQSGSTSSRGSICGNCDVGRVVRFYCFDCKHFLCEPCTDAHNKMKLFTQGHKVVELAKFSSEDCKKLCWKTW